MASKKKNAKNAPALTALTGNALRSNGEAIAALRNDGKTWDEIGKLVSGTDRPVSAIPLRVTYRAFLAENDDAKVAAAKAGKADVSPVEATAANVVRLRDGEGAGFPLIAARTGLTVPAVRDLYAKGGGETPDGRIYVRADGSRTFVSAVGAKAVTLPAFDAKAAKARAKAAKAGKAETAETTPETTPETAETKAERKARKAAKRAAKAAKAERKAAKRNAA